MGHEAEHNCATYPRAVSKGRWLKAGTARLVLDYVSSELRPKEG